LTLRDEVARTYGNSLVIEIEWFKCDIKVELHQLQGTPVGQTAMDINRRMVYAASEMGVGRESMSAMHDILNMASLRNRSAWNSHI
jgi:hypothetical protein